MPRSLLVGLSMALGDRSFLLTLYTGFVAAFSLSIGTYGDLEVPLSQSGEKGMAKGLTSLQGVLLVGEGSWVI